MFLDQSFHWFWYNIPNNQSDLRTSLPFMSFLGLWQCCFYISVLHLWFLYEFRDNLWEGLGIELHLDRNFVPGSTKHIDPGTCFTWQNRAMMSGPCWALLISWWACMWAQKSHHIVWKGHYGLCWLIRPDSIATR